MGVAAVNKNSVISINSGRPRLSLYLLRRSALQKDAASTANAPPVHVFGSKHGKFQPKVAVQALDKNPIGEKKGGFIRASLPAKAHNNPNPQKHRPPHNRRAGYLQIQTRIC